MKLSSLNFNSNTNKCASNLRINFGNLEQISQLPYKSINNTDISVVLGSITNIVCDGYVVPQFENNASYGGVSGSIARAGGLNGVEEYDNIINTTGHLEPGDIVTTKSGGGGSKYLLNVVTAGLPKEKEFSAIQKSVYKALKLAQEMQMKSVAIPALGTGVLGKLTPEQSANAILSAIDKFAKEGGKLDISIAILNDEDIFNNFVSIMNKNSYENAKPETGKRVFDSSSFKRFFIEQSDDIQKNEGVFGLSAIDKREKSDAPITLGDYKFNFIISKNSKTHNAGYLVPTSVKYMPPGETAIAIPVTHIIKTKGGNFRVLNDNTGQKFEILA